MQQGLYDPRFEHDACGVGFVARVSGTPSREIVEMGLEALARLAHRGAVAADGRSGDGAGITTSIPRSLLQRSLTDTGLQIPSDIPLAVGMVFFDSEELSAAADQLRAAIEAQDLRFLCWREVPVNPEALGHTALASMPVIRQALIARQPEFCQNEFESRLHRARKQFERAGLKSYVASLSSRTIVYKALCAGGHLREFYLDLQNPEFESSFVLFH